MDARDNPALGYRGCGECGDYGIRRVIDETKPQDSTEREKIVWCKCPRGTFAENHWHEGVRELRDRRSAAKSKGQY